MRKLIILILLVLVFPFISADQSGGVLTGEQGKCIDLSQECVSCSFVTLKSINFPNLTKVNFNTAMTGSAGSYNSTFCGTDTLGVYSYCVTGDVDAIATDVCKDFEITVDGSNFEGPEAGIYIILIVFVFIMFIMLLFAGIGLPFFNGVDDRGNVISVEIKKYPKIMCLFLAYLLFVWFINLLLTLSRNLVSLTQFTAFFNMTFIILRASFWPVFVIMIIWFFVLGARDLKLQDFLSRGIIPS